MKERLVGLLIITIALVSTVAFAQTWVGDQNYADSIKVGHHIYTDSIQEYTSGAGVSLDGVTLKDNAVSVDTVSEKTSGAGVTVDGVKLKDGGASIFTGGTNTFNVTNGTASLDVAAGAAVDIDANLTVESASVVDQDLSSDASPTFAGGDLSEGNLTNVGSIALDSITADDTSIDITGPVNAMVLANSGALPGTCTAGTWYLDTGGATEELCYCSAADTWKCAALNAGAAD